MENASNAILMAGGILVGVVLISIAVFAFNAGADFARSSEQEVVIREVQEFNSKFEIMVGRTDIKAQEIIGIINYIQKYNLSIENANAQIIRVRIGNTDRTNFSETEKQVFMQNAYKIVAGKNVQKTYKMGNITYNSANKLIKEIQFVEL